LTEFEPSQKGYRALTKGQAGDSPEIPETPFADSNDGRTGDDGADKYPCPFAFVFDVFAEDK
jgi:hypothetical protein